MKIKRLALLLLSALLLLQCACFRAEDPAAGSPDKQTPYTPPATEDTGDKEPAGSAPETVPEPVSQTLEPEAVELPEEFASPFSAFLHLTGNLPDVTTISESLIFEDGFCNIAIHYPTFAAEPLDQITKSRAMDMAEAFKAGVAAAMMPPEAPADGETDPADTFVPPVLPEGGYELLVDFKVYHPYDSFISIQYDLYRKGPDAALRENERWGRNYDTKRDREITLWRLLDGKYLKFLSEYCFAEVVASGAFSGDAEILKTQKLSPAQKNFSNFILMRDYIVFFFPQIYSWDMGGDVPWVAVSYADLDDYISGDYRAVLSRIPGDRSGDEPAEETAPPVYLEDRLEVFGDLPQVAISFDDGPSSLTPHLLDILAENNAHATFFVLGNKVGANTETLRRMLDEGHEIGNHTWSHKSLAGLTRTVFDDQVLRTQQAVMDATGFEPRLLRPSYGAVDADVKLYSPLPLALWSIDPYDWKYRDADTLVPLVLAGLKDGDIILLHDTYSSTIETAERVLHELDGLGFKVVTVSQILRRHGETLIPGEVYRKNPPSLPVS